MRPKTRSERRVLHEFSALAGRSAVSTSASGRLRKLIDGKTQAGWWFPQLYREEELLPAAGRPTA